MINQYFQLVFKGRNAYIHIYPPSEGGERVLVKELTDYLDARRYDDYDIKEINRILQSNDEAETYVGEWDGLEVGEVMQPIISPDKMKAVCRFYPASKGGKRLTVHDILGSLTSSKVRFGLQQQVIYEFLQNPRYCTDYVFAKGQEAVQGKDATIEYYFNTNVNLQPRRNEDGSVNYKELNTISHVKKGELLAKLFPEERGTAGINVCGNEILPRAVKTAKLAYGKNIAVSPDQTELYSEVSGHANCINGKVFVSDVFEVPADVDNSVGNIDYRGSVLIHGNVKTGFTVKASGDVIIEGVVEGAQIEAGRQIIVKHGIHGMFKGNLRAGTNLLAKYIESTTVYAGGYVEAEIILNSDVSAADSVRVKGKKGLINGGKIRAGVSVEAENIGTQMGSATLIEVGMELGKKERYAELNQEAGKLEKEIQETQVILANYTSRIRKGERLPQDKLVYVQQIAASYKNMTERLAPMKDELARMHEEMQETHYAYVAAAKNIYPGVTLCISDLTYSLKDKRSHCKFKKQDGEIRSDIY